MLITRITATHIEASAWGDFAYREDDLPLVTGMSIYPQYKHPISTWRPEERMCVVEVETEDGLVGTGWCEDYYQMASSIVNGHLARLLIGADSDKISLLWNQMFRATVPYGRKGAALYGISAVDIALWDLKGKKFNQPIFQLLGGRCSESVPIYASHLHCIEEHQFCAEAETYVKRGFPAMKMRFLWGPSDGLKGIHRNVALVKLLRETVGDTIEIMADAYMGWSLDYALRITRLLEPFNLRWIEEPLLPDETEAYTILTRESPVPIAAGEHEYTRWGFEPLIRNRALDVIQFDMSRVGGFSEAKKVCAMADAAGLPVCTHAYGMPALQLATAESVCLMVEYFPIPVWMEGTERPFFDGAPIPNNGKVRLKDTPGAGMKLELPGYSL